MERGGTATELTPTSAVQDVEEHLGLSVVSIINLNDLLAFMDSSSEKQKAFPITVMLLQPTALSTAPKQDLSLNTGSGRELHHKCSLLLSIAQSCLGIGHTSKLMRSGQTRELLGAPIKSDGFC